MSKLFIKLKENTDTNNLYSVYDQIRKMYHNLFIDKTQCNFKVDIYYPLHKYNSNA